MSTNKITNIFNFFLFIIYINSNDIDNFNKDVFEKNLFLKNSQMISLYFFNKIKINKKNNIFYYKNLNNNIYINIIFLKLSIYKNKKNFNEILNYFNLNEESLNSILLNLIDEINLLKKDKNYTSDFILNINLAIFSLNFLIYINNKKNYSNFLELNNYSIYISDILYNIIKETINDLNLKDFDINLFYYILINSEKLNDSFLFNSNNFIDINNIFIYMYINNLNIDKIKFFFFNVEKNISIYLNFNKKKLKELLNEEKENLLKNKINFDFLNNNDLLNKINTIKNEEFLNNYLYKKYNNVKKKIISINLTYINDMSYYLIGTTIFYDNIFISEFGEKYWTNTSLDFNLMYLNLYQKILINLKNDNLFEYSDNYYFKKYFFSIEKFHIKNNNYNKNKSSFNINQINNILKKYEKKVYYINFENFIYLYNLFENILKKNIKIYNENNFIFFINLYNELFKKIDNFNFIDIENNIESEEKKQIIFYELLYNFINFYIIYIDKIIINKDFLLNFYNENNLIIISNYVINELILIKKVLIEERNFNNFNLTLKYIKNIKILLNDTLYTKINILENKNNNSNVFIENNYYDYLYFIKLFNNLINYSEQIINNYNLKNKIEKELNIKKFNLIIKLDFRGRIYVINTSKAYDNNKLIRQSLNIKNNIKFSKLIKWFLNLYEINNIKNIKDLEFETYDFLFNNKEFFKYKYLYEIELKNYNKKDWFNYIKLKSIKNILSYYGFLNLNKDKQKNYNKLKILELGYNIFFNKYKIIKNFSIEETLEIKNLENFLNNIENINDLNYLLEKDFLLNLDSSCNGYTHLLFTFSNLNESEFNEYLKLLNLTNSNLNYDFYSEVLSLISKKNKFLNNYIENNIIDRKTIKHVVMTIPYNAKEYSFKEKLSKYLNIENKKEKEKIIYELIKFFLNDFKNNIIDNDFSKNLENILNENNDILDIIYKPDDETNISLAYYEQKDEKILYYNNINNKSKSVYIKKITNILDKKKTIQAIIANIIHANDSYIIKEIINSIDLNILTIHDCIKFNSFLLEEILIIYETNFFKFYKNFNIYEKVYFIDKKTLKIEKLFNEKTIKKYNIKYSKCPYILKF